MEREQAGDLDLLEPIYDAVNWDVTQPAQCELCRDIAWPPTAGCYPTALTHYEQILGAFPQKQTGARILMIFQDPRPLELNFRPADPRRHARSLVRDEHRYFCLSPAAWTALGLDEATGSRAPCWPERESAPAFLRRYLSRSGAWSYDGFLAYFLHLLRPAAAVITDVAKCHFGDAQGRRVFERCASVHLEQEARLLRANLILSFTATLRNRKLIDAHVPSLRDVPMLTLLHPAAWPNREKRRRRFVEEVHREGPALRKLGYEASALELQWNNDVRLA